MRVIKGDLFQLHVANPNCSICIPTNGIVKPNGELVMGAGLAREAYKRFPVVASLFGKATKKYGVQTLYHGKSRIFCFPTKYHWKVDSSLELIDKSAFELLGHTYDLFENLEKIYLPKVGCGLGKLTWQQVEPVLDKWLNTEQFTVVEL